MTGRQIGGLALLAALGAAGLAAATPGIAGQDHAARAGRDADASGIVSAADRKLLHEKCAAGRDASTVDPDDRRFIRCDNGKVTDDPQAVAAVDRIVGRASVYADRAMRKVDRAKIDAAVRVAEAKLAAIDTRAIRAEAIRSAMASVRDQAALMRRLRPEIERARDAALRAQAEIDDADIDRALREADEALERVERDR